jgi:hypothetical protein
VEGGENSLRYGRKRQAILGYRENTLANQIALEYFRSI